MNDSGQRWSCTGALHSPGTMGAVSAEPSPSPGQHMGSGTARGTNILKKIGAKVCFYGRGLKQRSAASVLSLLEPFAGSQISPFAQRGNGQVGGNGNHPPPKPKRFSHGTNLTLERRCLVLPGLARAAGTSQDTGRWK